MKRYTLFGAVAATLVGLAMTHVASAQPGRADLYQVDVELAEGSFTSSIQVSLDYQAVPGGFRMVASRQVV